MRQWWLSAWLVLGFGCAQGDGSAIDEAGSDGTTRDRSPACIAKSMQALSACADHAETLRGIDISAWQGDVDWAAVADDGVVFAFVRVSDGLDYADKYFASNWQGAKQNGIVRGVYQFFRPTQDPIEQAQMMIDAIEAAGGLDDGDLPPVIDLEDDDGVDAETYKARAHQWIDYVEAQTGRRPIVYTAAFFSEFVGETFTDHPLWVANYKSSYVGSCPAMPDSFSDWVVWQWTDSGSVAGVAGGVDENIFDGSRAELDAFIASSHLNAPEPEVDAGTDDSADPDASVGEDDAADDDGVSAPATNEPGADGDGAAMGAGSECEEGDEPAEDGTDDAPATPSSNDGCPAPSDAPVLAPDDAAHFCPEGFSYDATHQLCVSDTEAVGPFTPAMIEACELCGGSACDEPRWPVDQARGLRGTGECMPGTERSSTGLCVDATSAFGPFTPAHVAACIEAGGGQGACTSMRWDRGFAERTQPPGEIGPSDPSSRPWTYIMTINLGVRDDSLGAGHFGASRSGNPGGHSGIDFLAPVGTPLLAPCEGDAVSGVASGYGNYVQLVCAIPREIAGDESLWASVFFAHLDQIDITSSAHVSRGQQVGTVGKTGNAASAGIGPHVHFEMAIHGSASDAFSESHASSNHTSNAASDLFAPRFDASCLTPRAFTALTGPTMKGRRPDPFMLLACLAEDRPAMSDPASSLQSTPVPWSEHYEASFDVDGAS